MGNEVSSDEDVPETSAIDALSWKFVSTPHKFAHVAVSQFTVVCADVNGMVWMLNDKLLHSKTWIKLSGIGVGFVTEVAVRSSQRKFGSGILSEPDKIFALDEDGLLWAWNKQSWTSVKSEVTLQTGIVQALHFVHISLGSQYLWAVDRTSVLWRRSDSGVFGERWEQVREKVDCVAAGQDGSVFIVQDSNCIYSLHGSNWTSIDGFFEKLAVYDAKTILALNNLGEVYLRNEVVDAEQSSNWERVYHRTFRCVALGQHDYNHAWAINEKGEAWTYLSEEGSFQAAECAFDQEIIVEFEQKARLVEEEQARTRANNASFDVMTTEELKVAALYKKLT